MAIIGTTLDCLGSWEGLPTIVGRTSAAEPTQGWEVDATALERKPDEVTRKALGGKSCANVNTATNNAVSRLADLRAAIVSMQRRST